MSEFRNPGDFRGAVVIQGSKLALGTGLAPAFVEQEALESAEEQFASLPLDEIPAPAAVANGSYIQVRQNRLFVGRGEDVKRLAAIIKVGEVAAVTGLGGLGKTQLAAEFAHRYGQFFAGGVFWLNCSRPEDVASQVARCGGARGLALRDDFDKLSQQQQIAIVLGMWSNALPRLLIFDNCEGEELLEQWRPTAGGARVLVTSRKANWPRAVGVQTVALGTLTPAESVALLHKYLPELSENDADLAAIGAELGYLPLALHLAGSYLERYHAAVAGRPANYLAELRRSDLLKHTSLVGGGISPTGHELHVANTFALSWGKLESAKQIDEMARYALICGSCFAPGEPIPRDLLKASVGVKDDAVEVERLVEDALGRALGLGSLEERIDGALALHRLLSAFVRREAGAAWSTALDAVEQTALEVATKLNREGYPARLTQWRSHLRVIAEAAAERGSARAGALLNTLGYHLRMNAEFTDARAVYERALAIDEQAYGREHPEVAADVNNLGTVLQELGDLVGARAAFERALAIDERVYGREHPNVARDVNNLGGVLEDLGNLGGARAAFERALAIDEQAYGREHPEVATVVNALGLVLQELGDLASARAAFERALAIDERIYGREHPNVARDVNNLGSVLENLGDLAGARAAFQRALGIDEHVYGSEHPEVATAVNDLGLVLQALGDLVGARAAYERALAIDVRVYGREHPNVARDVNNLGSVLEDLGDLAGARAAYERALAIDEQVYGSEHPEVATDVNNLGNVLQALGDLAGARAAYERALAILFRAGLPADHPHIRSVRDHIESLNLKKMSKTSWTTEKMMAENKFKNTGNFTGANVFQGSTIYNAGQIASTLINADDDSRNELQGLIGQLGEAVKAIPPDKKDDAEALGASAEDLMKEASKEAPNKPRLRSLGEGLVGMAKTVGAAAPAVISIAGSIVDLIGKIHGLG